ncbi:cbb3-type cytochrome c oxidase subunit 3 [Kiloniella laminariae]|nr:cbb3-type cytochrome c oxidase subunit 3 [Kiloniella laminariae]
MDYSDVSHFSQTWGLVYLVIMFLAGVVYALWPRNKDKFDHAANIPLEDD